jgi:hypothetical protein
MRRISWLVLFTLIAVAIAVACTPFNGQDVGAAGDSDAAATADGATTTDGASTTEGGAIQDGGGGGTAFDATGCTLGATANFEDGKLPPAMSQWQQTLYLAYADGGDAAPSAIIDDMNAAAPTTRSMKASFNLAEASSGHAGIKATFSGAGQPDHVALLYSMEIGSAFDTSGFYAEIGCTLSIDGLDVLFEHDNTSGQYSINFGPTKFIDALPISPGSWYDVRYDLRGLATGSASLVMSLKAHGAPDSAWQDFPITGVNPKSPGADIVLLCGIAYTSAGTNAPNLAVNVDEISYYTCQ